MKYEARQGCDGLHRIWAKMPVSTVFGKEDDQDFLSPEQKAWVVVDFRETQKEAEMRLHELRQAQKE